MKHLLHCMSFSGTYFPVFGLNTGKYGQEKTTYLDTFHAVSIILEKCSEYLTSFSRKLFQEEDPS